MGGCLGYEEAVGDLQQNTGPVAGDPIAAGGSAVLEVHQDLVAQIENVVAAGSVNADHRAHTAGVVFVLLAVQSLLVVL